MFYEDEGRREVFVILGARDIVRGRFYVKFVNLKYCAAGLFAYQDSEMETLGLREKNVLRAKKRRSQPAQKPVQ